MIHFIILLYDVILRFFSHDFFKPNFVSVNVRQVRFFRTTIFPKQKHVWKGPKYLPYSEYSCVRNTVFDDEDIVRYRY
jgi:hypothetical protein